MPEITAAIGIFLIFAGIFILGFWSVAIPIFFYVASLGMILPNATAGALAEQSENTGSASALIGTLQYGLEAIASSIVSYFNNGTSLPMSAVIGICGITAFLILNLLLGAKTKQKLKVAEEHITFG